AAAATEATSSARRLRSVVTSRFGMFMAASASRRDRLNGGSAKLAVSVAGPSARPTPPVQVVRAICLNIYENDQDSARRFWGDGYCRCKAMHDSRQSEAFGAVTIQQRRLYHCEL